MMDLSQMLLEKSVEAFTLAIEIYNKPTIRYRVEGFCFFICNAWELMLKAHIIKNGKEARRSLHPGQRSSCPADTPDGFFSFAGY